MDFLRNDGAGKLKMLAADQTDQATNVLLTMAEYNSLKAGNSKSREISEGYGRKLQDITLELELMTERAEAAESEAKKMSELNKNLKRVCRENANAKRGLKKKKQHDGFLVRKTWDYVEFIKNPDFKGEMRTYRSLIQTPYSKHIAASCFKEAAWEEGLNRFFDDYLDTLYIPENSQGVPVEAIMLDNNYAYVNRHKNFLYRQDWQTGKNGLWQIICYHTKEIVIPFEEFESNKVDEADEEDDYQEGLWNFFGQNFKDYT